MTSSFSRLTLISALTVASLLSVPTVAGSMSLPFGGDGGAAAGTVALEATAAHELALGSEGLMPGDSITGAIALRNAADRELRYSATSSTAGVPEGRAALASILEVSIRLADSTAGADGAGAEDPCRDGTGAVVRAAAPLDAAGSLLGDPSLGSDAGDRELAAGTSEILCVTVAMPITAGNEYQGASTALSVVFSSEATGNNP